MTTEYASPATLAWRSAPTHKAAVRPRFQPSAGALKITYVGCGIALTMGLALGFELRPDYAAGEGSAGPRIVVSSAPAAAATSPNYIPAP